jgi:threonine synthase
MAIAEERISRLAFLQCSACTRRSSVHSLQTVASCETCGSSPLVAHYEWHQVSKDSIDREENSMWRYAEMLPLIDMRNKVTLGEGWTPLLETERLANNAGLERLWIKDESQNATGSFKARGLSMAISKAKELGVKECIIPTAGNAGGAMAAYCARAGMYATVVMPSHTPEAFKKECRYFGATLIEVQGLISDCGKKVSEMNRDGRYFDVSTMKEPYRLEGKKTMGYEIAEQLAWDLPEVILYPTGGGTGLIGMWKAFREMMMMGWISQRMPRFIAVQSENCQPVVDSFEHSDVTSAVSPTIANGLAVPAPFAKQMILQILKDSRGTAISVSENEIREGVKVLAATEGLLVCPEGGALISALKKLLRKKQIHSEERVLLLNTGSAYKYLENL